MAWSPLWNDESLQYEETSILGSTPGIVEGCWRPWAKQWSDMACQWLLEGMWEVKCYCDHWHADSLSQMAKSGKVAELKQLLCISNDNGFKALIWWPKKNVKKMARWIVCSYETARLLDNITLLLQCDTTNLSTSLAMHKDILGRTCSERLGRALSISR